MESVITDHAEKRLRKRIGLNKSSLQKMTDKALEKGISHAETSGSLHRYIDKLYLTERKANNIKIYGEYVYLFRDSTLITVFALPSKFHKIVRNKEKI